VGNNKGEKREGDKDKKDMKEERVNLFCVQFLLQHPLIVIEQILSTIMNILSAMLIGGPEF
jgi:hypothetical protein